MWHRKGFKLLESLATKNNLSEAAVDELLGMLSNLCTFLVQSICNASYCIYDYYILLHIITCNDIFIITY